MWLLEGSPKLGRLGRVAGTRELIITSTPYVIAYRLLDLEIEILRVIHSPMRWPRAFLGVRLRRSLLVTIIYDKGVLFAVSCGSMLVDPPHMVVDLGSSSLFSGKTIRMQGVTRMAKKGSIRGNQDGAGGRNDTYSIWGRGNVSRVQLVREVKSGKHPDFTTATTGNWEHVRSKPDRSVDNNINGPN